MQRWALSLYILCVWKQKCLYSWKLERTDRLPKGKRECVALRDQIAELNKVQSQGIAYHGGGMTVLELVDKYTLTEERCKIYNTSRIQNSNKYN